MVAAKILRNQPRGSLEAHGMGPLSNLIGVQMRRVDSLLTRGFALDSSLRPGIVSCLGLIAGNPGISQNELAEYLGVDKSVVVALMHALEAAGWARRDRSAKDRRRHALHATTAGESELARIAANVRAFEARLLAKISSGELKSLGELLERMHASCVEALTDEPPGSATQSELRS